MAMRRTQAVRKGGHLDVPAHPAGRARCTCLRHWGRAYVAHASALSGVVLNLNELVPVSFDPGQAVGLLTAAGMPTAVLSWSVTPKIRTSS